MTHLEFNNQITTHTQKLRAYSIQLTGDMEDAKDLFQETILKAIKYREKFVDPSNLKAWLYTIMRNTFINDYRRKVKYTNASINNDEFVNRNAENSITPIDEIQFDYINNLIADLKSEFSFPFKQFVKGFKYKEIAEQMDLPIGTVKSRIHEARKQLIQQIQR